MDLRELYQEVILDHGKNPRNHRFPEPHNREGRGYNPLCGARRFPMWASSAKGVPSLRHRAPR